MTQVAASITDAAHGSSLSDELAVSTDRWPPRHRLPRSWRHLLDPLMLSDQLRILELGAGTGAVTRMLKESGSQVIAVEATQSRAKAAAARCRDLRNVEALRGTSDELPTAKLDPVVCVDGIGRAAALAEDGCDGGEDPQLRWLYPDHKRPTVIVNSRTFDEPDATMIDQLVGDLCAPRPGQTSKAADARAAHRMAISASRGPDLANSLLIVAGRNPQLPLLAGEAHQPRARRIACIAAPVLARGVSLALPADRLDSNLENIIVMHGATTGASSVTSADCDLNVAATLVGGRLEFVDRGWPDIGPFHAELMLSRPLRNAAWRLLSACAPNPWADADGR